MKSNFSKGLLMTALITGSVIWGGHKRICRRAAGVFVGPNGCNSDENRKKGFGYSGCC